MYRTTRSASLTETGEVFLHNAKALIDTHHLTDQRMAQFLRGEEGTVCLDFVASAALGIIPRLAAKLHQVAPGIKFSLREMTSDEQILRMKAGDIDVEVIREIREYSGLRIETLEVEPLRLAVPLTHAIAAHSSVSFTELRSESFVMFPRTNISFLHDHIHRLCRDAGFTPTHVVEEAMQFATTVGLVSSNAGIAIVPEGIRAIQLPSVASLPIDEPAAVSKLYIATRASERASPTAQRLVGVASTGAS